MRYPLPLLKSAYGQQLVEIKYCQNCRAGLIGKPLIHLINIAQDVPVKRFCCQSCKEAYLITIQTEEVEQRSVFFPKKLNWRR